MTALPSESPASSSELESTDEMYSLDLELLKKTQGPKSKGNWCSNLFSATDAPQLERTLLFDGKGGCAIRPENERFPKNAVNNRRYSLFTFIPLFLFDQFKQFGNAYFLAVALTQLPVPGSPFECLWFGQWYTNVVPLVVVILFAMVKEAMSQFSRYRQDCKVNNEKYTKLTYDEKQKKGITVSIKAKDIRVGDLIILEENQRVPADLVLLWCSNKSGTTFIRTDQLDGETDWKLRKPIQSIQSKFTSTNAHDVVGLKGQLKVEPPHQDIYEFRGMFQDADGSDCIGLNLENTLWSSTVIASGQVVGVAVYSGKQTRSVLNASEAKYKVGRLDEEINFYTKVLFASLLVLSLILSFGRGFHSNWYVYFGRFILLLSAIIPISLRVHLDMAKLYFSWNIEHDRKIPGTIVRTTTIPEELGRVQYLFTDKTGTLTRNVMVFKKLQLQPPYLYEEGSLDVLRRSTRIGFSGYHRQQRERMREQMRRESEKETQSLCRNQSDESLWSELSGATAATTVSTKRRRRQSVISQVVDIMSALALCHNVTPIVSVRDAQGNPIKIEYQASSPDEIALVKFCEKCGVMLIARDEESITLRVEVEDDESITLNFSILNVFPFSSETKRMGIILKAKTLHNEGDGGDMDDDGEIVFFAKGADCVMKSMMGGAVEWLDEEVESMGREGLRTLVFAKKVLSRKIYNEFKARYDEASVSMSCNRAELMQSVRERLELDLDLIGISGVEDKLQEELQPTLETLRNAHIAVWMLTGDKMETALVIARSSKLVPYGQQFFSLEAANPREAQHRLDLLGGQHNGQSIAIVIDGKSLAIYMKRFRKEFVENAVEATVVVCCRCSPTQKAEMVELVKNHTGAICAAIGDGGNDVAMIQRASIGIGIEGLEGQQASFASDVSIKEFKNIAPLLLWHGRLAYKNTAKMTLFIFHRGAIMALIQCMFSVVFYLSAIPLFSGLVSVGYTCLYTNGPVAAMVLDKDITRFAAMFYPELYHQLHQGTALDHSSVLGWTIRSVFQGGVIMLASLLLFEGSAHNIMTIAFTALIITELMNIACEVKRWHWFMGFCLCLSFTMYYITVFLPIPVVENFFDVEFIKTPEFWGKSLLTGALAVAPLALMQYISRKLKPTAQSKLKDKPRLSSMIDERQ